MKEEHIEYVSCVRETILEAIRFLTSYENSSKDDMKACIRLGELVQSLSIFLEEVKYCKNPDKYEYELFVSTPREGIYKFGVAESKEEAHDWYLESTKTRSYQVRKIND